MAPELGKDQVPKFVDACSSSALSPPVSPGTEGEGGCMEQSRGPRPPEPSPPHRTHTAHRSLLLEQHPPSVRPPCPAPCPAPHMATAAQASSLTQTHASSEPVSPASPFPGGSMSGRDPLRQKEAWPSPRPPGASRIGSSSGWGWSSRAECTVQPQVQPPGPAPWALRGPSTPGAAWVGEAPCLLHTCPFEEVDLEPGAS